MKKNLTQGNVTKTMLLFAGPMIAGNLLQQFYNIADTLIVGRFLGADALAAVGSGDREKMKSSMQIAFLFIGGLALLINIGALLFVKQILWLLQVPEEVFAQMQEYVWIIFFGIFFVFLYNFFAFLLRAVGNSFVPLCFLGSTAILNIVLDLVFVPICGWGIGGAAIATVISQVVSGVGISAYTWIKEPSLRFLEGGLPKRRGAVAEVLRFSFAYMLAPLPGIGVQGIWWAIPIGWFLADVAGVLCLRWKQK